jgi:hypothetical protein
MPVLRSGLGALAIVSAALVAVSPVASGISVASATPSPTWRMYDVPVQGRANLLGVTTVTRDDAWAAGFTARDKTAAAKALATPKDTARPNLKDGTCETQGLSSLMLHWNGAAWRQVTIPSLGRVNHVSASGAKDVWASADCGILHWNGRAWTQTSFATLPGTDQFYHSGIKAVGAKDAWLTGLAWNSQTGATRGFVQRWDGRRWRLVRLPALGDSFSLDSIDARGSRDVWAVGTDYTGNDTHAEHMLLLHWNGRSWKRLPEPETGEWTKRLLRVRALAGNDVWIAGMGQHVPNGNDIRRPLILHWNGRTWADTPTPGGRGNLSDIAATGRTVLAVGDTYSPFDPTYTAYALRWNTNRWTGAPVPVPGEASIVALAPIPGGGMWSTGASGEASGMHPFIARQD